MKKWLAGIGTMILVIGAFTFMAQTGHAQTQTQAQTQSQVQTQTQAQAQTRVGTLRKDTELYMHVGSPVAVADGKLLSLDKDNPQLAPVIRQTRTLVPLRVISEYFGAQVSYDTDKGEASIDTGIHKAVFPVGKKHYMLDGTEKPLDVGTMLISGRAFVPLREICQETLGYTVDYQDDLIYVAPAAKLTQERIRDMKSRIGMYIKVNDLDALNRYMDSGASKEYFLYDDVVDVFPEAEAPQQRMAQESGAAKAVGSASLAGSASAFAPSAPASAPVPDLQESDEQEQVYNAQDANAGMSGSGAYTATNVQTQGVDEGDILKTDGKYLYVISGSILKVIDAAKMEPAGEFYLGEGAYAQEMYVDRDRVIVIGSRSDTRIITPAYNEAADALRSLAYHESRQYAFVRILDTGNMAAIKSFRYYEVEGNVSTSRKKDDTVYLVSEFSRWYRNGGGELRPMAGENGVLDYMPIESIMIMPGGYASSFLSVSAIPVRDAAEKAASETIAGSGYVTYMSRSNLYLAVHDGRYNEKETMNIARFSLDGTKIAYAGSGSVEGGVNNQFSMDESGGDLRVATTVNWPQNYNNLYILDKNMEIRGKVLGYAQGERIYSARFMGDRAYVVTFRQIDPLFVFDLSDPDSPRISGELKAPGFSSYLHPVSRDVILGVGKDVYDLYRVDSKGNQVVVGQQSGGLKISLFDVSDMGKPKEIDTLILGEYGESSLLYNHKAAMFKAEDSLLGLCGSVSEKQNYFQGAFLVSYAGNKLIETGRLAYENPYAEYSKGEDILSIEQRLVSIGETLYYLQDGLLRSYELSTLKPVSSLRLVRGSR